MGARIMHLAQEDQDFEISALLEHRGHPGVGGQADNIEIKSEPEAIKGSNVLIEFTTPEATLEHLAACVKYRTKMVIGTTGILPEQVRVIEAASKKIPIVFSSNMSVGVNILFKLLRDAAKATANYDVRIVEAHHVHKKDAPSGTAKTLAKIVEETSSNKVSDIKAIREGEIIGDHDVIFESEVDILTLRHHAKTRDIFAKGALIAAKFVATQKKGLFNMQDVLGLK